MQRLREEERKRIMALLSRSLTDVNQAIRDRTLAIERIGHDAGPAHTERLHQLQSDLAYITTEPMTAALKQMEEDLPRVAEGEAAWQQSVVQGAVPFRVDFGLPAPEVLQAIGENAVIRGHPLEQWWREIPRKAARDAQRTIEVGIVSGKTNEKIVREMLDSGGGPVAAFRSNAETIVRTSVMEVSDEARQKTYEENEDIVKGWQFVATLDTRTSLQCIALDGKTFDLGDEDAEKFRPPIHPNCRSTTVPVLKSYEEIGLKGVRQYKASAGTRASMDGQVPATTTYPEWLKGQPEWVQDEVLGPARADLFRDGTPVEEFVTEHGKTLTLEEVHTLERQDEAGFTPDQAPLADMPPDVLAAYKEMQRQQVNAQSLMSKLSARGKETWTPEQTTRFALLEAQTAARSAQMKEVRMTGVLPQGVITPPQVTPTPPAPPPAPPKTIAAPPAVVPIHEKPTEPPPVLPPPAPPTPAVTLEDHLTEMKRLQTNEKSLMSKLKAKQATWTPAQAQRYAELEASTKARAEHIDQVKTTGIVPAAPPGTPTKPAVTTVKPTAAEVKKAAGPDGAWTEERHALYVEKEVAKGPDIRRQFEALKPTQAQVLSQHQRETRLRAAEGQQAGLMRQQDEIIRSQNRLKVKGTMTPDQQTRYDELEKQRLALVEDTKKASAKIVTLREQQVKVFELERAKAHELLKVRPEARATFELDVSAEKKRPETQAVAKTAAEFLRSVSVKDIETDFTLAKYKGKDRSNASRTNLLPTVKDPAEPDDWNFAGQVKLEPGDTQADTAVHEFGHCIEYANRGPRRAVVDFLLQRDQGFNTQPLKVLEHKGYRADEFASDNPIWKRTGTHYSGKTNLAKLGSASTYRGRRSTETLSMGIEMLYRDPVWFAQQDPEFFDLIVGIVHGQYPQPVIT